ncbi:MAG: FGGY-family carbohydrate kinase [Deltaproteobacteria bacterium]|nr:FGGY-family carbohydrate kinase [Deltaproteobacteria bacterium]
MIRRMATPLVLSVDLGTGGPKVALVDALGNIAASAVRSVQTRLLPDHGAEQDAEEIWRSVIDAANEVLDRARGSRSAVQAVTCTSQYFSLVCLDRTLRPAMNLIVWMDTRGGAQTRSLYDREAEVFQTWLEIHGMLPLPSGNDSLSHMLWVKEARPEVYDRTYKFVEPVDFLLARFTGSVTANLCSAFALLLTDNRQLDRPAYSPQLLALSGIDPAKLPDLVEINADLGTLAPQVARQLGLPDGVKVFSGTNDTQAVAVGTATFHGGAALNVGTTSQVVAHVEEKKTDIAAGIVSMPSPIRGRYVAMAENGLGGKTLDHFLRQIIFANDRLADHSQDDLFAGVDATVREVPPGARGLLYLPWLSGSGSPRGHHRARGGFLNMSLECGRAEMLRAVLEGVALNLRWLVEPMQAFVGRRFDGFAFSGGGAMSQQWGQTMADVMQVPVSPLADPRHVNNRATAFLAFVETGVLGLDDIGSMCRTGPTYEPRQELRDLYDRRFEQFVAAFENNLPIFEALNE